MASEPWITWEKKEKQVPGLCRFIFSEEMMAMFLRSTSKSAAPEERAVPGGGSVWRPRCRMELFRREVCVQSPAKLSPALCSATQHSSSALQQELWQKPHSRDLRFCGFAWLWEHLLHKSIWAAPPWPPGCAAASCWGQALGSPCSSWAWKRGHSQWCGTGARSCSCSPSLFPLAAPGELVFLPAVYPTGIPGITVLLLGK